MKLLIALGAASLVFGACSGDDDSLSVTGTVATPDDGADPTELPTDATLTVTLQNISVADAAAVIISSELIELSDTEFPVAFELPYELGDIAPQGNTYSVAARVESDGDLLMISDTVVPVITNGAPTAGVEVALVSIAAN